VQAFWTCFVSEAGFLGPTIPSVVDETPAFESAHGVSGLRVYREQGGVYTNICRCAEHLALRIYEIADTIQRNTTRRPEDANAVECVDL
jgi:hypothetical protein